MIINKWVIISEKIHQLTCIESTTKVILYAETRPVYPTPTPVIINKLPTHNVPSDSIFPCPHGRSILAEMNKLNNHIGKYILR